MKMDTHCPPLCYTALTTHHPPWDTQEDPSHQTVHSTQSLRPHKNPRLSSNLTELSLQISEAPNHLAGQRQQRGGLNSSSDFQAQHVQSYTSFKPNNYSSIAASSIGPNPSSANATEFNMTPSHEDFQEYSERPQVLNARNRQVRTPEPLIVNIAAVCNHCSHITLSHQRRVNLLSSKRLIRCKNISLAVPPTRRMTKSRTLLASLMSRSIRPFRLWIQLRTTSDPEQTWTGFRSISSGSNSTLPTGRGISYASTITCDEPPVTRQAKFSTFIPGFISTLNPIPCTTLAASGLTEGLRNCVPNTAEPLETKQAIRNLFGRVRSRTRLLPPNTLKELYQAGFNSLNAKTCRDLLEIKTVLFHMFYSKQGRVLFGRFYAARKDVNITEEDKETIAWTLCIRSVFKTNIQLREYLMTNQ
ncbi:unnamed protein product [Penicillium olsonii]|nr:unnamed protein product [Penicillium olsonii]